MPKASNDGTRERRKSLDARLKRLEARRSVAGEGRWPRSPRAEPGSTRARLEDSLLRRVEGLLEESVSRMSEPEIMLAVEAPTPAATVVRMISASPDVGLSRESGWIQALARGAVRKQQLIERAGGCYSSGEVAELLGITVSAVNLRKKRRRILTVPLSGGESGFPVRQFAETEVRAGVAEVVHAAGEMNPWVLLSILLSPAASPEGPALLDALDDAEVLADVLARVRGYGVHGAV